MSVDFNAVAQAIAVRFSATNVTAPTGEQPVALATEALPGAIVDEPTLLVYPPTNISLEYTSGTRSGMAVFPVRFYIYKIRDTGRNATLILKWLGALYAQLDGQVHLGLPDYVTHAVVRGISAGELTYAGETYHGVELSVEVHFWEALAAVA